VTSDIEREALIEAFLGRAGLADAAREPLPADASTRRYVRLRPAAGAPVMLMDQPPQLESAPCPPEATAEERIALGFNATYRVAAGRVDAFVACAGWLKAQELSAPRVIAAHVPNGLAILEDLGDDLFARVLEQGADEAALYDAAVDTLVDLHRRSPPEVLEAGGARWPLLVYDDLALKAAGDLLIGWLPLYADLPPFSEEARAEWEAFWAPVRRHAEATAEVFCHRDYHAENLIWLPEREGPARVGLLDFQDALRANRAWDFSMLLHDARRDVSPEMRRRCLARYLEAMPEVEREGFLSDFHTLGALNILRIIGIFSRLVHRDGKPRYRAFMPRMWSYLHECLHEPALASLRAWMDRYVPASVRT